VSFVTTPAPRPPRRSDTRQRIQDVALELFAEQGYEKTSLREIAERLGVTKAALYYHFRAKEDIVISLLEDLTRPLNELVAWAEDRPPTLETSLEVLRRYAGTLRDAGPFFRFMQENHAALRELRSGEDFRDRMLRMVRLLLPPDASLADHARCAGALFTLHAGPFSMRDLPGSEDEKLTAALTVAEELITAAHAGGPAAG
jgi:AcrR family transcriptional regulator